LLLAFGLTDLLQTQTKTEEKAKTIKVKQKVKKNSTKKYLEQTVKAHCQCLNNGQQNKVTGRA